ncbi:enoyl-CoA hydratase/isomerase family protein [Muriicola sp.]|uniref:enoyl-CoA hydratase/isomerase family protein n=1 Tax=Muriicola sp. TaxID=2020856 RepID=UPI003C740609
MGTSRTNGSLYTNIQNKVATVEFGHPASNSFVSELLQRLTKTLDELSQNKEVSLVVLRSEGDGPFCAGASFNELMAVSSQEEGTVFFSGFAHVLNAMRRCSQPIIGRVQGKAVGGGVGLIAACDYVFASVDAAVRLSELTIGIAPLVIAPALERKIGVAGLAEMSLAPTEWKNAYWAKEKGLFSKVHDTRKEMDKELDHFTSQLGSNNPEALRELKKVLWQGTDHWDQLLPTRAAITGNLALSPHTKKALEAFKK